MLLLPRAVSLTTTLLSLTSDSFLGPSSSISKENSAILEPLGDLKASAKLWAAEAGKQVLQGIDSPTFHALRTCQILTTYWFAVGDSQRNTMFSGS